MDIAGAKIHDKNIIFRFCLYIFSGLAIFAVLLSWRSQLIFSSEYQNTVVLKHRQPTKLEQQKKELLQELNTK